MCLLVIDVTEITRPKETGHIAVQDTKGHGDATKINHIGRGPKLIGHEQCGPKVGLQLVSCTPPTGTLQERSDDEITRNGNGTKNEGIQ